MDGLSLLLCKMRTASLLAPTVIVIPKMDDLPTLERAEGELGKILAAISKRVEELKAELPADGEGENGDNE